MRKVVCTSLLVVFSICLLGCKSKEEKSAELIKNELSKTLYDFESYQPIETRVTDAKVCIYNDSTCWRMGATLAYGMQQVVECREKMDNAKEHMSIWGSPSYYSSSYSDNQYYKYRGEYMDALSEMTAGLIVCKTLAEALKDTVANLDTSMVIGWEVFHDFRCKTRGGSPEIGHYRYIISKDFKTIILCEDTEGKLDKRTREALETITSDYWDELEME